MRVYSEAEVNELLRRAAAMQATAPARHGLTLDEVQKAAEAAGIDPSFVAAAAAQPVHAAALSTPPGRGFWGGPYTLRHERTLRTALDDEAWGEIVGELRRAYGTTGTVSEAGAMRDWTNGITSAGSTYFYQRLSATPRRGQTTLLLEEKMHNASAWYVLPMMAFVGTMLSGLFWGLGEAPPLAFAVATLALVVSFVGARALYASATTRAARRAAETLDRIDERLDALHEDAASVATAPVATAPVSAAPVATRPVSAAAPALVLPTEEAPSEDVFGATASVPASSRVAGRG